MSKSSNRSASAIITSFTEQYQEIQLLEAQRQLDDMTKEIMQRRKKLLQKLNKNKSKSPEKVDVSKAEKFKNMDEHSIPLSELEKRLETSSIIGLNKSQIDAKIQQYGRNVLSQKESTPWYMKLIHELTSVFALLIWAGAALCFIAFGLSPEDPSNLYLGIVLIIVVVVTAVITFFQNQKSEAIMEAFKNFIPPETLVIRDGEQQKLQATELVPGDVVIVEFGKRIPADIRIIESNEMKVDNSSLTGESALLTRSPECTHPQNPLETKNLAFFGTLCKEGNGKGIVLFTGDKTVIGQIAGLVDSSEQEETPLKKELNAFITYIAYIAPPTGVVFFVLGFAVGYPPVTNLIFAIGIVICFQLNNIYDYIRQIFKINRLLEIFSKLNQFLRITYKKYNQKTTFLQILQYSCYPKYLSNLNPFINHNLQDIDIII